MKSKVGGSSKKIGRNKDKCAKYSLTHQREHNKIRKWKKMIKKLPANNETCIELKNKIRGLERVI